VGHDLFLRLGSPDISAPHAALGSAPHPNTSYNARPMAAAQIGQGTNSFCLFVSSLLFIEIICSEADTRSVPSDALRGGSPYRGRS
jgi:hypothetical protein